MNTAAEKSKTVAAILKQKTYTPGESRMYLRTAAALSTLSLDALRNLQIILIIKQQEAIELARQVDKILAK